MKFQVCERGEEIQYLHDTVFLVRDNWDDFNFKTTFSVSYCINPNNIKYIGQIKIGVRGMEAEERIFDVLPKEFFKLDDSFFSLGQDEIVYANICELGDEKRINFLTALRDVAYDLEHYRSVRSERVMKKSLLRSISEFSVEDQFHRIAHGGAHLTEYRFSYTIQNFENESDNAKITFNVIPKSNPPTNIHVLIGRNGTGKTTLIKNFISSICDKNSIYGIFDYESIGQISSQARFANVLCVAFSPFDNYAETANSDSDIPYTFIGLNKNSGDLFKAIENHFCESFSNCMINARKRELWLKAIHILKSDPTFDDLAIDAMATSSYPEGNKILSIPETESVRALFSTLSSGHKVVLLIVTCCVDKIKEKSIVFLDEPENHLHPPLLSALIRALSDLLMDRNGVAIISTHSPVILQEVPSSCVWALRRSGEKLIAERLEMNTFGASIGSLTNEVFRLEVTNSGYHRMIAKAVEEQNDYDSVMSYFNNQLGNEATILLRTLLALKKIKNEDPK